MEKDSNSEKPCIVIFGQQFCNKLEHIPIKKRILLRDSALYQRTPSLADGVDKKIGCLPVAPISNLLVSPSVSQHSDSNAQQVDNLKSVQLDDMRREVPVLNDKKAECHSDFSGVKSDNANKVLSPCTKSKVTSVSSFGPVARDDGTYTKSTEAVSGLKDLEAVQSMTPKNRILWDLNVVMDAWAKPNNLLNVEYKSDLTTSDMQSGSNLERSEDFSMKVDSLVSENDTECKLQPSFESVNSAARCKSVKENQQVAPGSFSYKACSIAKASSETVKNDEELTLTPAETASELLASASRKVSGRSFEIPNYSDLSTEEQNCDSKNIIVEGGGSVNILQVCDDEGDGSSKKRETGKAGQLNVIDLNSCVDVHNQRAYAEEGGHLTLNEKVMAKTVKAPLVHPPEKVTENSPKPDDIDMGNQLLNCFQEGCDASVVDPLGVPAKSKQDATIIKQVTNMDRDNEPQTEQDYEDGELRDLDMDFWNENEIEMRETGYFDHKPVTGNMGDMDKSHTSVSAVGKDESRLKSKQSRSSGTLTKDQLSRKDGSNADEKVISGLSGSEYRTHINTQLVKKLSGWDQLPKPKDGYTPLEKVQGTHANISRTSRSKLQSSVDVPTRSEDAEEKETVVERRFRHKVMDDSYPANSDSGFDKLSGKRRSTPHVHRRNRAEDGESERRSSVNSQDLYDNHSGSRRLTSYKGRVHLRSRSPSDRNEVYDPYVSYPRYSTRGRRGGRAEGSGRSSRGARNGCRGSLTDEHSESEFCLRQQFLRGERSLSPRTNPNFPVSFNRSRSRSRTRSPPSWIPPYEWLGSKGHRRSPEFNADDRVKRSRLRFWKSNFSPDTEMRYTSPTRTGFIPQSKSRWKDDENFDMGGLRDRSPVRRFRHKERFDTTFSHGRVKSIEDFRPTGYPGKMREIASPDRVRSYNDGKDKRKYEDSFEIGHKRRYYKDGFSRRYRHDDDIDVAPQKFHLKDEILEDRETRSVNVHKKGSRSHETDECDQRSYPASTPNAKR